MLHRDNENYKIGKWKDSERDADYILSFFVPFGDVGKISI